MEMSSRIGGVIILLVNIGENIRKYRTKAKLSREKLVLKCKGTFSAAHLLSIEKGKTKSPGIAIVAAIADTLGISVDELLGRTTKREGHS